MIFIYFHRCRISTDDDDDDDDDDGCPTVNQGLGMPQ